MANTVVYDKYAGCLNPPGPIMSTYMEITLENLQGDLTRMIYPYGEMNFARDPFMIFWTQIGAPSKSVSYFIS